MSPLQDLVVESTAEPAELRAALDHLGDRERAALHRIHDIVDLRDDASADRLS